MNVFNVFDGISCGQIALNKQIIPYDSYISSEIDSYAINVTQNNYPRTRQVGDITKLKGHMFPKIDLYMGGSPCQGFSFAGKQLNFNDHRSKLFFEYVRLLEEIKPTYFLLENVLMKQEYQDVITSYLGVKPIQINSSLVSAQYRRRLYWTNIPNVTLPKDRNIFINDILEDNISGLKISFDENGIYKGLANNGKTVILESNYPPPYSIYESRTEIAKAARRESMKLHGIDTNPRGPNYKEYRINKKDKCNCILTTRTELDNIIDRQYNYRPLTIIEAERLQTVPDNYTNYASDSQRWKMLGNGWTVDVIAHILSYIK
jgi:DNA-cytosine methyltransferase